MTRFVYLGKVATLFKQKKEQSNNYKKSHIITTKP